MSTEINLDRYDLALLRALQRNARASLQELSAEVGLSSSPCWSRIKRMEEAGVIQGYTIKVDAELVGVPDELIVQLTLDSHSEDALEAFGRQLEAIPEVIEAYLVSGDYDYVLRIAVKGTRDYARMLREQLYKIPGIRHSKSSFVLRRLKSGHLSL